MSIISELVVTTVIGLNYQTGLLSVQVEQHGSTHRSLGDSVLEWDRVNREGHIRAADEGGDHFLNLGSPPRVHPGGPAS